MDGLVLVDTFGVLNPPAAAYMTRKVQERITKPLETHFHMDFGLGVANTVTAVAQGVDTVQVSVSGVGERSGNVPLEDTVMALKLLYGVESSVDTTKLYGLSKLVRELAGVPVPPNRGIVGDRIFHVESGIITTWVKNVKTEHLTEAFPFRPELVGQTGPEIVIGKGSGLDSVHIWLERVGLPPVGEEDAMAILTDVKAMSLRKKALLTEEEFRSVAESVDRRAERRVAMATDAHIANIPQLDEDAIEDDELREVLALAAGTKSPPPQWYRTIGAQPGGREGVPHVLGPPASRRHGSPRDQGARANPDRPDDRLRVLCAAGFSARRDRRGDEAVVRPSELGAPGPANPRRASLRTDAHARRRSGRGGLRGASRAVHVCRDHRACGLLLPDDGRKSHGEELGHRAACRRRHPRRGHVDSPRVR